MLAGLPYTTLRDAILTHRPWLKGSIHFFPVLSRKGALSRHGPEISTSHGFTVLKMGSFDSRCIRQIAESIPELLNHKVERAMYRPACVVFLSGAFCEYIGAFC